MKLIMLERPVSNLYSRTLVPVEAVKSVNVETTGGDKKVWLDIGEGVGSLLWFTSNDSESMVLSRIEKEFE